jgi:serine/threonine protein kinase
VTRVDRTATLAAALPEYQILELLAADGDGDVYVAWQHGAADRAVTLKVSRWTVTTEARRAEFAREVAAAAALSAAGHVARLYDSGLLPGGQPYLVTEYCPGSLAGQLRTHGPLPPEAAARIGVALARTLAGVHRTGRVHGALTPSTVLLRADATPVLAVFGVGVMVNAGAPVVREGVLSFGYAAREVVYGRKPTPAADVYSLAATLYAALSGRPPRFPPDREPSPMEQIALYERPVPDVPGVPAGLLAVLRRALHNEPERRPSSADDLADELAAPGRAES